MICWYTHFRTPPICVYEIAYTVYPILAGMMLVTSSHCWLLRWLVGFNTLLDCLSNLLTSLLDVLMRLQLPMFLFFFLQIGIDWDETGAPSFVFHDGDGSQNRSNFPCFFWMKIHVWNILIYTILYHICGPKHQLFEWCFYSSEDSTDVRQEKGQRKMADYVSQARLPRMLGLVILPNSWGSILN